MENDYKRIFEEMQCLKSDIEKITDEKTIETEKYNKEINEIKIERDRCIKETTDLLARDHKVEMENLRARFKLVTTPAEVDRGDAEALKQKYELEKQKLISIEAEKWQKILDENIERMKREYNSERDALISDVGKRISEEKDKQIEFLREREANLTLEVNKHKNTIQQLVQSESENGNSSQLRDKIDTLEQEKCQLEAELSMERSKRLNIQTSQDMSASVAVYEGNYFLNLKTELYF